MTKTDKVLVDTSNAIMPEEKRLATQQFDELSKFESYPLSGPILYKVNDEKSAGHTRTDSEDNSTPF